MEFLYEILGILLFGGITIGIWLTVIQDLNLRKKYHEKEMEKIEIEIKKIEQAIQDSDAITRETIHQLKSCSIKF